MPTTEGGIVISMMRMNRVLEVDYENQLAVVEPGLVNLHLSWKVGPAATTTRPIPRASRRARSAATSPTTPAARTP
jgi:glycolate oxidase